MDAWVRKRLYEFLKTESDFEAFCQDYFSETAQKFGAGMDRQARTSLLLQRESAASVLKKLRDEFPNQIPAGPASDSADPRSEASLRQRAFGHGDPYLHCDRGKQFEYMRGALARPDHQVVLLPGSQGEAHEFFLARLEVALPSNLPRKVLRVPWRKARPPSPSFPVDRRDFVAALLTALGHPSSSESTLPSVLSRNLQHHSLVLLHPIVRRGHEHEALVQYYTDWLPALLAPLRTEHACKLVQPIEWQADSRGPSPEPTPGSVLAPSEAAARTLINRLVRLDHILETPRIGAYGSMGLQQKGQRPIQRMRRAWSRRQTSPRVQCGDAVRAGLGSASLRRGGLFCACRFF